MTAVAKLKGGAGSLLLKMPLPLVEGKDFYCEGAFVVFTESYLRERGYCCESGCRHCPWGFRRETRSDVPAGEGDGKA